MNHCIDTEKAISRLKKIEGQVRGIRNMIEDEEREISCDDVLIQIGAVKSALYKVGQIILERHLKRCVVDGIKAGNEDVTIKQLAHALDRFSRIR